jgi:hypothetical protein
MFAVLHVLWQAFQGFLAVYILLLISVAAFWLHDARKDPRYIIFGDTVWERWQWWATARYPWDEDGDDPMFWSWVSYFPPFVPFNEAIMIFINCWDYYEEQYEKRHPRSGEPPKVTHSGH